MNYQSSVDNDLQKAIDDITKTTDSDPIFSDPVAAPVENQDAAPTPVPVSMPEIPMAPEPYTEASFAPEEIAPAPAAPAMPEIPAMPEVSAPAPVAEAPAETPAPAPEAPAMPFLDTESLDKDQVKEAALRSLAPICDKLDISASRKFEIYKNVIDNYNDTSVLEPAYHTATEIEDEGERAEALLYLVDSIDKM